MTSTRTLAAAILAWALVAGEAHAQAVSGDDAPLRFGRFEHQGEVRYGFLGAGGINELDRNFLEPGAQLTGRAFQPEEVRLLAPVTPSKVIGVAINYKSNEGPKSDEPKFFAKLPSAVVGPEAEIVPPPGSTELHYEGELVVVIGARARNVSEAEAADYVFGVTAGNDVTERGFPFSPFDVLRAKGSDTMSPLGPWVVPGLSYDRLKLTTRVNGEVVQESSTADMVHGVGAHHRDHLALHHTGAGRPHLYRHARRDAADEGGRRGRSRDRRRGGAEKHGSGRRVRELDGIRIQSTGSGWQTRWGQVLRQSAGRR